MQKFTKNTGKIFVVFPTLFAVLFAFSALAYAPSVQTNSVGSVSGSCAALQGYTSSNGTQFSRWFEIKELNKNMKPITVGGGGSSGSSWYHGSYGNSNGGYGYEEGYYKSEAKNLIPDTDYVYRAVAQNSDGISYGREVAFHTKSSKYQSDAFAGCSEYVPMTTNENVIVNVDTGAVVPFNSTSLSMGSSNYSSYSYPSGTQTNNTNTNTNALNQSVVSLNASDIRETSARLNARTYPTQNIVQYGRFLWGKTAALGNSTPRVMLGTGASLFLFQDLTGLIPGTTYYYKPVIDNQLGTTEGQIGSFTTTGSAPFASGSGWTSYDSSYSSSYTSPVSGGVVKTSANKTLDAADVSGRETVSDGDKNTEQNNASVVAAAALADKSYSIFPRTLGDWFTIITLLFIFVLAYFSWKFYMIRKEENSGEFPDVLGEIEPVEAESPKKPLSEVLPINNGILNTVKGAPPENLPV
jgi:hypothetical protein